MTGADAAVPAPRPVAEPAVAGLLAEVDARMAAYAARAYAPATAAAYGEDPEDDPGPMCEAAADTVEGMPDAADKAAATFTAGDLGPQALHRLRIFGSEAGATVTDGGEWRRCAMQRAASPRHTDLFC